MVGWVTERLGEGLFELSVRTASGLLALPQASACLKQPQTAGRPSMGCAPPRNTPVVCAACQDQSNTPLPSSSLAPLLLCACPQIKEEQAERERQQDLRYMQQQREQLDRQEAQRRQLLDKVKAVQVGGL